MEPKLDIQRDPFHSSLIDYTNCYIQRHFASVTVGLGSGISFKSSCVDDMVLM